MNLDSRRRVLSKAILSVLCASVVASATWAQSHHHHGQDPQGHPPASDAKHGGDRAPDADVPPLAPQAGHEHATGNKDDHDGHGMHGMVVKESKDFPTIGYDDVRGSRPMQKKHGSAATGDPVVGKRLAQSDKGRCLSCHVLDHDGALPGDVGPNLSAYATWGRDPAYTFQQVWDARVHNPHTTMPPFGTNDLLSEVEVTHIVAYLYTLKKLITEQQRPSARKPRERVFVAGVDFSAADEYIDAGRAAFGELGKNGRSCDSCHAPGANTSASLNGAASRYPMFDRSLGRIVGLEERVNDCRQRRMASDPLPLGDRIMNQLTSYVKFLGRGKAINTEGDTSTAAFERGRASFYRKAGQLNLSCADCHLNADGMWLRGQRIQKLDQIAGQWPKHYIALHDLGLINLRQRIQHCQIVMLTFPLPLHAQEYSDLEYYLTRLSNGSRMLAPTMTRLRGE